MPITHVVQQGECISSVARRYGFHDWRTLFEDPANAELRALRSDPNILLPGDVVTIPERQPRAESRATAQRHRFVVARAPTLLRLQIRVSAAHCYELIVGSETFTGTTDGAAPIEHPIPADARGGQLRLWPDDGDNAPDRLGQQVWQLRIGDLDPKDELSGVQGRLQNLGLYHGEVDGQPGDATTEALRAFQRLLGLEPTGELDEALRGRLVEHHDGP